MTQFYKFGSCSNMCQNSVTIELAGKEAKTCARTSGARLGLLLFYAVRTAVRNAAAGATAGDASVLCVLGVTVTTKPAVTTVGYTPFRVHSTSYLFAKSPVLL